MPDDEQTGLTDQQQEQWRELIDTPHEELSDSEVTAKVRLSIRRRFSSPEWVLVFEFGGPDGRRADCIAVNSLPSRNHKIVGFEFKASRSDWLAEKNEGQKADHFVQICDEWYVVTGRSGIVDEKELPEGWGLLELKPNSEQIWKLQESELTEYQQGEPDRRFWAKFLKKTVGSESNYTAEDLREARKRGYEEAAEEGVDHKTDWEIERLKKKAENWDRLEESGLDWFYRLDEDQIERLEVAYRLVEAIQSDNYSELGGALDFLGDQIERKAEEMRESVTEIQEGLEQLDQALEEVHLPEGGEPGDD